MSDPKTSTVFVRLTRDFPAGATHRRAGLELGAGPQPVEVEVTDEQLEALKADRYIELVDDKEAKKWNDRLGEQPVASSADHSSVTGKDDQTGRNYGDEETPEQKQAREDQEAADAAEKERRANTPTAEELVKDNNRDALVQKATDAGVEGLDFADTKVATKAALAEAIVAKREASSSEE